MFRSISLAGILVLALVFEAAAQDTGLVYAPLSGAIGGLSPPPPPRTEIIQGLKHPNLSVRRKTAERMWELVPGDLLAILPAVVQASRDFDDAVRADATTALANLKSRAVVMILVHWGAENPFARCLVNLLEPPLPPEQLVVRVEACIAKLRHADESVRVEAQNELPAPYDPIPAAALDILLAASRDADPRVRVPVAQCLARRGVATRESLATLLDVLRGGDDSARREVVSILPKLGTRSWAAVPILFDDLSDPRPTGSRAELASTLARLASYSPEVLPRLRKLLHHDLADVRRAVVWSFQDLSFPPPLVATDLIPLLLDPDASVRAAAVAVIDSLEEPSHLLLHAYSQQLLSDPSSSVRERMAYALADSAERTPQEIDLLRGLLLDVYGQAGSAAAWALGDRERQRALDDPDPRIRRSLVYTLSSNKDLIPRLVQFLSDKVASVRSAAASQLSDVGSPLIPDDTTFWTLGEWQARVDHERAMLPAVEKLLRLLKEDPDSEVRCAVARALGSIAPRTAEIIPALGSAVADGDTNVAEAACHGLASIGPPAASTVPALCDALGNNPVSLRQAAAWAIGRTDPGAAIDALAKALADPDERVRYSAVDALASVRGDCADKAAVVLFDFARRQGPQYIARNCGQWVDLAKASPVAVSRMTELLDIDDDRTRRSLISALGEVGPNAAGAVPRILTHFDDDVVEALAKIGPDARRTVPQLVTLIAAAGGFPEYRFNEEYYDQAAGNDPFIAVLDDIGPTAAPELFRQLGASDPRRQLAALWALATLDLRQYTKSPPVIAHLGSVQITILNAIGVTYSNLTPEGRLNPESDATYLTSHDFPNEWVGGAIPMSARAAAAIIEQVAATALRLYKLLH